jgi:hypothetical protein
MDAYPDDYVAHNLPFFLISGLGDSSDHDDSSLEGQYPLLKENGLQIESDFPPLIGSLADDLRSAFRDHDASDAPWNSRAHTGQIAGNGVKIKNIGRVSWSPSSSASSEVEVSQVGKLMDDNLPTIDFPYNIYKLSHDYTFVISFMIC